MHHFIADAPWEDEVVLSTVREYVMPALLKHGGVATWIMDDTGIPKKGTHSVGVAPADCGQLGKRENCQVSVSLSLANETASLPIGFELYLPQAWGEDLERRPQAGVPAKLKFRTKPEMALEQIQAAVAAGVPHGVVTADAGYGNDTKFREGVTALGLSYAVGIQETTTVWPEGQGPMAPAPARATGRSSTRLRRDRQHQPVSVKQLALALPEKMFRTVTWREGARGLMQSRFGAVRVRPAHHDYKRSEPRAQEWLVMEWPTGATEPTKYWLSTLSPRTSRQKLVSSIKLRWRIERDYQELKDEIGLGHFEGRGWRGFHHHATMCIAAYAFLVAERGTFSPVEIKAHRNSEQLPYPEVTDPEAPPLRPEPLQAESMNMFVTQ